MSAAYKAELERLYRRDGHLTPEQVLKEATKKTSPLHKYFEWDNTSAARRYRLSQAGELIRRCKVTIEATPEKTIKVRKFVSIPKEDGTGPEYVGTVDALSDDRRELVLAQARRDLAAFRRKYEALIDVDKLLLESIKSDEEAA